MEEPKFLSLEDVLLIHAHGIEEHGGASGIRDRGAVESAVDAPRNLHAYEEAEIPVLAAAYLFSLCRNHGFVDGNKRVALRTADTFLILHGILLAITNEQAVEATINVATGEWDRSELADFFEKNCHPLGTSE